jgi:hypothetical protein
MSIATYDITVDEVLYYLPQYQVAGNTVPNRDQITDHFLTRAATDVAVALDEGGFGLTPSVTSSVNPYAYHYIRNAIIARAALFFAQANRNYFPDIDSLEGEHSKNDAILLKMSQGNTIGELEPSDGYKSTNFYIGSTDSQDDLDDTRFSWVNDGL